MAGVWHWFILLRFFPTSLHAVGPILSTPFQHPFTSTTSSSSVVHKLHQFWIDGLVSFLQHFDQLPGLFQVPWCEECVGSTLVGATGSTANSVHIILRAVWIVVVYHKLYVFHILWVSQLAKHSEGVGLRKGRRREGRANERWGARMQVTVIRRKKSKLVIACNKDKTDSSQKSI